MEEVKSIKGLKEFTANGNKYTVMDRLSIDRWEQYEKLQPQLTYGASFDQMFSNLKKAYASLDKQKFADAAVIIHNLMSGIKDIEDDKRIHPALHIAALFIVRDGEDVKVYDKKVMEDKIYDWTQEGLNIQDFFSLAVSSIKGFKETLLKYTLEKTNEIQTDLTS